MIVVTVPIVLAGWALSGVLNECNSPLRSLSVVAWACIALGVLLGLAEVLARHLRRLESATLKDAFMIGIAQVGALVPGVSRSGATITASLALGFKREDAARLSFLIGIPAIALAGARELWVLRHANLSQHGWAVLGIGLLTASASAFVGLWLLMRVLDKWSAWPFAVYRVALGVILLFLVSRGWS
jgi:undecaprenyl-diphosphatase